MPGIFYPVVNRQAFFPRNSHIVVSTLELQAGAQHHSFQEPVRQRVLNFIPGIRIPWLNLSKRQGATITLNY